MKLKIGLVLGFNLILISSIIGNAEDSCTIRLTGKLVQDILDCINLIKPKIFSIQIDIENITEELGSCCELLNSKIDTITSSGVEQLVEEVSIIESELASCCEQLNSKIGNLDQDGSCLDSQIDVPDDINNLNLTVIQLLKTILLELRGCGDC